MSENRYQEYVMTIEAEPIDFMKLDPSVHETPEQLKRRISAKKIKSSALTDLGDHYSVTGSTGSCYITTLDFCSCFDFCARQLPCKHMYRFALDHDIIDDLPTVTPKNARLFAKNIDSEIERFRSYYEQGLISAEKFVKIVDSIQKGK